MSLRRQLATTYFAEGIRFCCALTFGIVAARALEPTGRGLFAAAWASVSIATMIVNFGIGKALISRLNEHEKTIEDRTYYGALVLYLPIASFFGIIAVGLLAPGFQPQERWLAYLIMALSVPILLVTQIAQSLLRARLRIIILNGIAVSTALIRVAALLGLWWFESVTVLAVLTIELVYWVMNGVACLALLNKRYYIRYSIHNSWKALKNLIGTGLSFQLYSMVFALQLKINILILEKMSGAEEAGYFAVGSRLAEYLWVISNQALFVLVPLMAQMKNANETRQHTLLMCRLGTLIMIPLALILIFIGKPMIILMYGEPFSLSVSPFQILLPGIVAGALFQLLSSGNVVKGKTITATLCAVAGLGINVVLMRLLIPEFQQNGAALAASGGYLTMLAVYLFCILNQESLKLKSIFIPGIQDVRLVFRRGE